jgi:hypothetical protein
MPDSTPQRTAPSLIDTALQIGSVTDQFVTAAEFSFPVGEGRKEAFARHFSVSLS